MNAETMARLVEYFDFKQFFQDNSPIKLAILLGIVCGLLIAAKVICRVFQKKLEKYASAPSDQDAQSSAPGAPKAMPKIDFDLFERVMKSARLVLYLMIFAWGLRQIELGPIYAEIVHILFTGACIWVGIIFFTSFIPFNIDIYLRRHGGTLKTSQSRSLMPIIKGFIWTIGITFMLDNLGFKVSTIITGLGVVGVAVGLACQAILTDFFSYIVILLDRPFLIGDWVELGEGKAGEVEYMGPKTTHLRNLDDDLIVCANSIMTKGMLVNQGSVHEREVIVNLGIAYDTPLEKIKALPAMLGDVINAFPQCGFDRACLLNFGPSNLQFEILYLVAQQRGGIRDFMNTRSAVNMAILDRLNKEGINMAYPTEHVLLSDLDAEAANAERQAAAASAPQAKPRAENAQG